MLTLGLVISALSLILMVAGGASAIFGAYTLFSNSTVLGITASSGTQFLVAGMIALLSGLVAYIVVYANRPDVSRIIDHKKEV